VAFGLVNFMVALRLLFAGFAVTVKVPLPLPFVSDNCNQSTSVSAFQSALFDVITTASAPPLESKTSLSGNGTTNFFLSVFPSAPYKSGRSGYI
jgi:hypothetical protein